MRYAYQALTRTLLRASPLVEPDSSRWGCEPPACRLFLDRLDTASEPRLGDAALVGAFARDPARFHDRVLARQTAGSDLVEEATRWARGIPEGYGSFRPASEEPLAPPVPEPDAGWEAWRDWWTAGRARRDEYRYLLRLHKGLTGRDALAELAADWPPQGNSARVVLGEILRALDAIPERTAEELRAEVLSADSGRTRRALGDLRTRILREGAEVEPATVAGLLAPLVDSIFARGGSPWPSVAGVDAGDPIRGHATSSHGIDSIPRFLQTGTVPDAVLSDLPERVTAITADEWDARDRRAGGHLFRFEPVLRWGPFLAVSWGWRVFDRREPDEAPLGYAGGGTLYLVETDDGWRVAGGLSWIT